MNMAAFKIGINGFNRFGQFVFRAALEKGVKVAAINDPFISIQRMVDMFKSDSAHGHLKCEISHKHNKLIVNGHEIIVFAQ